MPCGCCHIYCACCNDWPPTKPCRGGVRVKLALILLYLLSPVDLVPDFLPVIGCADDVTILAVVLRSAVRLAGSGPLRRHW